MNTSCDKQTVCRAPHPHRPSPRSHARSPRSRGRFLLALLFAGLPVAGTAGADGKAWPSGSLLPPLRNVVRIASHGSHTCVTLNSGAMRCWGDGIYGQLGDGGDMEQPFAVAVIGLASGVQSIATGAAHTCAVANGGARCWGYNYFGQVGNGTDTDRDLPTPVSGLGSGVTSIVAGSLHSCALTSAGGVRCWGQNGFGQLGDGTDTNRLTPVNVSGLSGGVQAIAAGGRHTCALTTTGGVKCWGDNEDGQLGDGTMTGRLTPVDVVGLGSGVQAISAGGSHTCALLSGGAIRCWGNNDEGQLGDGTTITRLTPVVVSGFTSGGHLVSAGEEHTCAVTSGGAVRCWGDNGVGQLGNGSYTSSGEPVQVTGLTGNVQAIAVGSGHSCAVLGNGEVRCWGGNWYGQLGDETFTDSNVPVTVRQSDGIFTTSFE